MMEALNMSSSSLKIISLSNNNNNKHDCCLPIRRRDLLPIAGAGQRNAGSRNKLSSRLITLQKKNRISLLPISASRLSYEPKINNLQDDEIQDLGSSKKVSVRFQLQRECSYGEQFYLVGDDPMFGLWNPDNAVPLEWSEGHIWTADLDIAIGKTIQFKFLLRGGGGGGIEDLTWQPGSDRVLTTWETSKRIMVCEDWDDVLVQKIMEEEEEEEEEMMPMPHEEEISNGAPPEADDVLKEAAAVMENVISRTSYAAAKMVEEEPEVTAA